VNLEKRLTNFVLFSIIAIISGLIKYREIEEYLQEVKKQNSIIEYIIEEELIKEIFKSAEMFDQKFNTMETNLKIIFERLTRNEQTVKKNSESINRIESDFKELQMEIVKLKRRVKILSAMTLGIPVLAIFLILLLL
jgi:predicted RNase H-like nuclease (RuvC/YqgF family)